MRAGRVLDKLLGSSEPALRWKVRTQVLGDAPHSHKLRRLEEQVRQSPRARAILQRRNRLGRPGTLRGVYYKWQGAHWALARLAEIGYPAGDETLHPMRDRVLRTWLGSVYFRERRLDGTGVDRRAHQVGVPLIEGRYRRCASQQGNALYSIARLGLDDGRCQELVERLLHWQWPDGGWNCDLTPTADTSSFMETLVPMVGLANFSAERRSRVAGQAARKASEVFLRRRLFRRVADGRVIRRDFVRLHYPVYYHYDILAGLRGMVAVGRVRDPRCSDALDLLESKRLADGGWPSEAKYYHYRPNAYASQSEYVDWGGTSSSRMNPWVTADALGVLHAADRLSI